MRLQDAAFYRCPETGSTLTLLAEHTEADEVLSGALLNGHGQHYPIIDGIPDLTWPRELLPSDAETRSAYDGMADDYDRYAELPFLTYRCDEHALRERMVDAMALKRGDRVLEIGCGTGRGAPHLARRVGPEGRLFLQEISPRLLARARHKLSAAGQPAELSVANGSFLPFSDASFDAAHHFGGINTFSDIGRCLSELARVVRPGGRVVFGDEGLGPWLRDTEMGRIMQNSNPLLKHEPPLALLPAVADDVRIDYVMMSAFWYVAFTVATAPPQPDYHLMIPSARGGSHWTRYHGRLEGVSDEAKALAKEAQQAAGVSMHDWLEAAVLEAARQQLKL